MGQTIQPCSTICFNYISINGHYKILETDIIEVHRVVIKKKMPGWIYSTHLFQYCSLRHWSRSSGRVPGVKKVLQPKLTSKIVFFYYWITCKSLCLMKTSKSTFCCPLFGQHFFLFSLWWISDSQVLCESFALLRSKKHEDKGHLCHGGWLTSVLQMKINFLFVKSEIGPPLAEKI